MKVREVIGPVLKEQGRDKAHNWVLGKTEALACSAESLTPIAITDNKIPSLGVSHTKENTVRINTSSTSTLAASILLTVISAIGTNYLMVYGW